MRSTVRWVGARWIVLCAAFAVAAAAVAAPADLREADAAWAARAEGHIDGRPQSARIDVAIAAYEAARTRDSQDLEARWKLVRALWFASEYATRDATARRKLLDRARTESDDALRIVADRVGGGAVLERTRPEDVRGRLRPDDVADAARVYFWSAIATGSWSRAAGLLSAVRDGVANQLHDHASRSVALDPSVDDGGALRLLSRLHAELPRVPLLSGWVDRSQAIPIAERAYATFPGHPGNAYVLGMALLDLGPNRRAEGLRLVERTANLTPRPDELIEDLSVRREARERLRSESR